MKILVACEESQAVTIEFRKLGHEAYSCDIEPCSGGHPEWHIQDDVLPLLNGDCVFKTCNNSIHNIKSEWDMIIAFPPCTYLSNVGAPHLFSRGGIIKNKERFENGIKAKQFFMKIYNADCEKIAIENPTPMSIWALPEKSQVIQPWQFGHEFQKRTQLWLKGLRPLVPTKIMEKREPTTIPGNWYNKAGKDRAKIRSKTFPGIAKAMAEQWGQGQSQFADLPIMEEL